MSWRCRSLAHPKPIAARTVQAAGRLGQMWIRPPSSRMLTGRMTPNPALVVAPLPEAEREAFADAAAGGAGPRKLGDNPLYRSAGNNGARKHVRPFSLLNVARRGRGIRWGITDGLAARGGGA